MAEKTVYIIGAGASNEAGLPTGEELKSEIANRLKIEFNDNFSGRMSGDLDIYQALVSLTGVGNELNKYLEMCQHIAANMPLAISIDNFIDSEKNNSKLALCGKLAITKSILAAEKNNKLNFINESSYRAVDFSSLNNTWYLSFFRTLTENCSAEDIKSRLQDITLIIFNYDRCIEHFLLFALMSYYRLTEKDAAIIISNITIIHPYGTVGSLPWQSSGSQTPVIFGGKLHSSQLVEYANKIRTFTEGAHSEHMGLLKERMEGAGRLICLGFSFLPLNMDLISDESFEGYNNRKEIICYATSLGVSKSDQEDIKNLIEHLYKNPIKINIEDCECKKLYLNYSRSLGYREKKLK